MNSEDLIKDILAIYNIENKMNHIQIQHRKDLASQFEITEVIADS